MHNRLIDITGNQYARLRVLGLSIDRAVHAEVWATDTIPADLPPMVEFKKKADRIIKERYGITVEHITAMRPNGGGKHFRATILHSTKESNLRTSLIWFPYCQRCVVQ